MGSRPSPALNGNTAIPSFKDPAGPPRPIPSEWESPADLLIRARTHEALAGSLGEKASRLDADGMLPVLQLIWRMARAHRIRAMLLRGQAASGEGGPGLRR